MSGLSYNGESLKPLSMIDGHFGPPMRICDIEITCSGEQSPELKVGAKLFDEYKNVIGLVEEILPTGLDLTLIKGGVYTRYE